MTAKERYIKAAVERMVNAGYSLEEAIEIAKDDYAIDHGKDTDRLEWEPTIEEEKEMRKNSKIVGKREVVADSEKKTRNVKRKEDPDKRELMSLVYAALAESEVKNLNLDNPERIVTFSFGGNDYTFTLTKKNKNLAARKAKANA